MADNSDVPKQGTSPGIAKDLSRLKYYLCEKKEFEKVIFQLFERQDDPYQYFLQLLPLGISPRSNRPNKLTFAILSNFKSWTENSPNLAPPSATHQSNALHLAMNLRNEGIMEKISRIFRIDGKSDPDVTKENLRNGDSETFSFESAVSGNSASFPEEKLMHQSMAQSSQGASLSAVEEDYDNLSKSFSDKKVFQDEIYELFGSQNDPYQYFLQLVTVAKPESYRLTKLLSEIFSRFEEWLRKTNAKPPSATHQESALDWAMNFGHRIALEMMSRIFQMEKIKFGVIDKHIRNGNFEMVAPTVKLLNLQREYSFQQLYFPLLCFNLKKDLKICLKGFQDLQQQFIENMDKLFYSEKKFFEAIKSVAKKFPTKTKSVVNDVKRYRNAMDEFLKEWNIPIESCENFLLEKRYLTTWYLYQLRKRKEISIAALAEMIDIAVGNEKYLAKDVIGALNAFDRVAGRAVSDKLKNLPITCEEYDNCSTDEYLQFGLSENEIIFVNDRETYERSIEEISKFKEIGFDVESQPNFGWGVERPALLQVATWDNVYLFDVISLSECLSNNWSSLGEKVFHNTDILKIGYGSKNDLHHLEEIILRSNKAARHKEFKNFMDLHTFSTWVSNLHPEIGEMLGFPHDDEGSPKKDRDDGGAAAAGASNKKVGGKKKKSAAKGLSGLCQQVLGKPSNKLERISDWEGRPLRKAQKLYAVLDAFCLLQILQKLEDKLNKLGFAKTDTIQKFFKETNASGRNVEEKKA